MMIQFETLTLTRTKLRAWDQTFFIVSRQGSREINLNLDRLWHCSVSVDSLTFNSRFITPVKDLISTGAPGIMLFTKMAFSKSYLSSDLTGSYTVIVSGRLFICFMVFWRILFTWAILCATATEMSKKCLFFYLPKPLHPCSNDKDAYLRL